MPVSHHFSTKSVFFLWIIIYQRENDCSDLWTLTIHFISHERDFFFLHNIHCWKTQKKANLHWIRRKNPERKGKEKNQNSTACSVTFIRFCDNADKLAIAKWCMIFQFVLSFYGKAKFRAIYDCRLNKKTWQSWNVQIFVCHVYFYSVSVHIHMSGMEYSNFVEQSASCRVEYTSNTCARRCLSVFLYNHRQFSPLSL